MTMGWYNVRLQMRSQLQLREAKGNDSTRESRWEGGEGRGEEISIWWFLQRAGGPPRIYVSSSFLCVSTGKSRFDSRNCGYFIAGTVDSDSWTGYLRVRFMT